MKELSTQDYQQQAEVTENLDLASIQNRLNNIPRLIHHMLGLCTEVGEIQDIIKKYTIYGKPLDEEHLVEELGDVLWYISGLCNTLDISMERVMYLNNKKLRARYPDGFKVYDALNRDLDKEKEVLTSG